MTVQEFCKIVEAQYVPNTTKELMRDLFRELRPGGIGVYAYARQFTKLSLFAPKDVTTDALRVGKFRPGF